MPQPDPVTGIRYHLGADKPSIPQATKNLVDNLRGKVIVGFKTVSARALAVTPAAFTPPGIPKGFPTYVEDVGQAFWNGTSWEPVHSGVPEIQDALGPASGAAGYSVDVPSGVWTLLITPRSGESSGSKLSIDAISALMPAGLYSIDVNVTWPSNPNGRRRMGISFTATAEPSNDRYTDARAAAAGLMQTSQHFGNVRNPSGQARAALWVYQDSGSTLSVTARGTFVRKVA